MNIPAELRYSKDHEWVKVEGNVATIGITDFAQEQLRTAFGGPAARKYFHREELLRLLEEHRSGRKDNSRKLWTVYAFCVWYDIYFQ